MDIQIIEDTYVNSWGGTPYLRNTNYGNATSLNLVGYTDQYGGDCWILIKFPPGSYAIKSLNLYCTAINANIQGVSIHKITSDWNEGTVTWNTLPTYQSIPFVSFDRQILKLNEYSVFDLFTDKDYFPYGILMKPIYSVSEWPATSFNSSENSSNKPYIVTVNGLLFFDQNSHMFFTDQGKRLDFSQIVAGNVSNIKSIDLYNYNDFSVSNVIVYLENLPSGDTIEISKFNNPFIPSQQVNFDGTFASNSKIGTFYIRVKPGENSSGSKSFRIKAKATPV